MQARRALAAAMVVVVWGIAACVGDKVAGSVEPGDAGGATGRDAGPAGSDGGGGSSTSGAVTESDGAANKPGDLCGYLGENKHPTCPDDGTGSDPSCGYGAHEGEPFCCPGNACSPTASCPGEAPSFECFSASHCDTGTCCIQGTVAKDIDRCGTAKSIQMAPGAGSACSCGAAGTTRLCNDDAGCGNTPCQDIRLVIPNPNGREAFIRMVKACVP